MNETYKVQATVAFSNKEEADGFASFLEDAMSEPDQSVVSAEIKRLYDDDGPLDNVPELSILPPVKEGIAEATKK